MTIVVTDSVCGVTIVAKVTDRLIIDYCGKGSDRQCNADWSDCGHSHLIPD